MPTLDLDTQCCRTRVVHWLLVLTGLFLLIALIGYQIASIESSRMRPEYWGEGYTTPSPLKPIPWIENLGTSIACIAALAVPITWIVAITRGHRAFNTPPVPRRHRSKRLLPFAGRALDIVAWFVCPALLLVMPIVFFVTMFWDAMHYFRQEDSVWPRGSNLWWAEEFSSAIGVELLLLLPGCLFFALTTYFTGIRHARRCDSTAMAQSRYAAGSTVIGTALLFLAWLLYFLAALRTLRHGAEHWGSTAYVKTPAAAHDGIVAAAMYIIAAWCGLMGIWSLFSAAIYELIIVDSIDLTIRPALTPSTHATASPPHPDS